MYFYVGIWSLLLGLFGTPLPFWAIYQSKKLGVSAWSLFKTPFIALLCLMLNITAPITMLFLVWTVKWDSTPTPGGDGGVPGTTIRGDMGIGKAWFQTPDERCPGDITQPAVGAWLTKYGKWWCTYLWLGTRNRMMGLSKSLGAERLATGVTNDDVYGPSDLVGYWSNGNAWKYTYVIAGLKWMVGWEVYHLLDGTYWCYPRYSMSKA